MHNITDAARLEALRQSQRLPLASLPNARELGGYVMADGRRIRRGLLLRTTQLANASPDDLARLADTYHVRLVLDMRGEREIEKTPDPEIPGARWVHDPIIDFVSLNSLAAKTQGHEEEAVDIERNMTPEIVRSLVDNGFFADSYKSYLESAFGQAGFRLFFREILALDSGAVLWHCLTGKDRTGLGAALLLTALGADEALVFADYELSNLFFAAECAASEQRFLSQGYPAEQAEQLAAIYHGVSAEQLRRAWDYLNSAWGSPEGYLRGALGLGDGDFAALRERYLEN